MQKWSRIVIYSHIKICSQDVGTEQIRAEIKKKKKQGSGTSIKYAAAERFTRSYRERVHDMVDIIRKVNK